MGEDYYSFTQLNRILCGATLLFLVLLVGVKLFIDSWNYEERPYLSYEVSSRFYTGEALIEVTKNNDLFSPSNGISYTALLTPQGKLVPLKHQTGSGFTFWSKDGAVMAFKGTMLPAQSSGCLEFFSEDKEPSLYTYAYDISTHREIYSVTPTKHLSQQIERLIRQHGSRSKRSQFQTILIDMAEQKKFEKADVNINEAVCD